MLKFRNDKGFTLIELIMVTIILGILAAVAVPRYLNVTQKAELAVERGVVTQLRAAVEQYADNKFASEGRYQYPENPFDLVEVEVFPDFDNNGFDVKITYKIIGADISPQELQFILQPTR